MKCNRQFNLILVCVVLVVAISACGGDGGTSSGGGTSFVGTYTGPGTVIATAPGVAPISDSETITVVVNADNTVIISASTDQFLGTISGNTFTVSIPASDLNKPGLVCTGVFSAVGTGSGITFTGTFSGSVVCNGVPVSVSGTFTATLVPAA